MADYVSRLTLDTSEHNAALQGATEKVGKYAKQTDDATKSIDGMQKTTSRSTKELLAQMSQMENVSRSTSGYKKQLGQLSQQIADLTINYRAMSEEQKGSAFGQEVAAKIQELTQKAADYKDAIVDAQAEVNALASDTANWDSMSSAISVTSSALQSFVATGALGEQTSEALIAVLAKLKAMETMTSAAIKIGNALQKQSALMLGIKRVQTLAATAATKAQADATVVATAKQRILNAVAKANPYVLLASAIIAVTAAIGAYILSSNKATKEEEQRAKRIEETKKAEEEFRKSVADNGAQVIATYERLRREWVALSNEHERKAWIEKNKTEFTNLGIAVENASDAENVFVRNTAALVSAFKLRAEAAAYGTKATDAYRKMIERQEQLQQRMVHVGDINRTTSSHSSTSGDEYIGNDGQWHFTQQGADKYNQKLMSDGTLTALKAEAERYVQAQIDLEAQAQELLKAGNIKTSTTTTPHIKSATPTKTEPQEVFAAGSLKKAQQDVAAIQHDLERAVIGTEDFNNLVIKLEAAKQKVAEIQNAMKVVGVDSRTDAERLVEEYDNIQKKVNDIIKQFRIGAIDKESALSAIDELNNGLASKGLNKIEVELDPQVDEEKVQEVATSISDIIGGAQSATNAVIGLGNSIKGMVENAEEMDAWDWFTSIMGFIWQLVDAFQAVNTMIEMFKTVQLAAGAASMTAATQEAGAAAVTATAASTEATANTAAAITGATKSGAKLPFPINLIAIAAGVAAVIGAIALIGSISGKFATGGIVGGGSYTGDTTLIRANAGEAVLNQRQQSHLFNILNGQSSNETISGGQVEFKIRGNELVGVLNNYSKKHNKV